MQQTDASSVSGIIAESDDEEDTTVRRGESNSRVPDVPQSLGLSINLSLLSSPQLLQLLPLLFFKDCNGV